MKKIVFYTKNDCSLCNAALFVVQRVQQAIPFELKIMDITAPGNEHWHQQFRHDIPVVHLDGKEIFRHRVNERRLRAYLTG